MNLIFLLLPFFSGDFDVPVVQKQIDALVVQLGDPKFKKREGASKALRLIGYNALATLEKATKNKDLEIARRAEAIIDNYWISYLDRFHSIPALHQFIPEPYQGHYQKKVAVLNKTIYDYSRNNWMDGTKLFIKDMTKLRVPAPVIEAQMQYEGVRGKNSYEYHDGSGNTMRYEYDTINKAIHPSLKPYLEKESWKKYFEADRKEVEKKYEEMRKKGQ